MDPCRETLVPSARRILVLSQATGRTLQRTGREINPRWTRAGVLNSSMAYFPAYSLSNCTQTRLNQTTHGVNYAIPGFALLKAWSICQNLK
jgi:uncharacterized protein (DUF697 family)